MSPEHIGVMIPIIGILVIGLILVTYYYLRSKERQMLIEKGLDAASIKEFFDQKKDPLRMMKIGIVVTAFGLGLGLGLALEDATHKEFYIPFSMFVITGLGFIAANLVSNKMNKKKETL